FRPLEGFWLPAEGTYSVRNGDRWRQVGTLRLRPDSLRFNQPIDPTSLQIAPPPGSDVVDHRRQPPVRFEQPYRRDSQELALLIDQTDKRLEAIGPDPDVDQLRQAISQVAADRTFSDISRAAGRIRYGLFLFKTARKLLAKATDERLTMAAARQLSRAALNLYSLWPDTSLLDEANKLIRQTRRRIKDRRDTAELLSYELNLRACKKLRQTRLRTEAAQSIRAEAEGLLQLYPDSEALAMTLLRVAQDLYHVDPTARKLLTALQKTAPSTRAARLAAGLQRVAATIGKQMDLTLASLDGTELSLAALRGKVVLLHFFMVGSPGGGWNLPGLRELFRRYHHLGLELIGVSLDSDPQRLKRFLKRIDLPWPVCCDGKGWDSPAVLALGVSELPAIFIIDRAGRLRSAFLPDVSASLVAALLSEPPPAVTTTRAATRPATKPAATSAAAPAISQPTRR
ncbi:MAG: peroxiredoxin family protein, partial [Phycisphaerae bacterium]